MNPTDPAFPCYAPSYIDHIRGMDLRTYIATQFLKGRVAYDGCAMPSRQACKGSTTPQLTRDDVIDLYVNLADALIERLNAKP